MFRQVLSSPATVGAMCLALTALPARAQSPRPTAWFTTLGEVRATPEGWVELRLGRPTALPPHFERPWAAGDVVLLRFAPRAARDWTAVARRVMSDTSGPRAMLAVPPLGESSGGVALTVHRDPPRVVYQLSIQGGACSGRGEQASRSEVLLLVRAIDAAARRALAFRADPVALVNRAAPLSDVTCPARIVRTRMPVWRPSFGRRGPARGEALARFAVTTTGEVDLATLRWDREPPRAAVAAARAALRDWRYLPARTSLGPVAQWTHAVVWFADTADAAERQGAGWAPTRAFVPRKDGFVEHARRDQWTDSVRRADESLWLRELYTPDAVRAWAARLAERDTGSARLEASGGTTRDDRLVGAGEGTPRFFRYDGCPVFPYPIAGNISLEDRAGLRDEALAAAAAASSRPPAAVDSTRVHGETEVTCPARPLSPLAASLGRREGAGEIAVSFVVGRDGRVRPSSVRLLGRALPGEAARVTRALAAQRWEPGRMAGVRVPQRAHLILYPIRARSPDRTRLACAQASRAAVRLTVRSPSRGIPSAELTRVAHAFSRELGKAGRPPVTDGAFTVVLDDVGDPHRFRWTRPPADSVGADIVRWTFRPRGPYDRVSLVPTVPDAPLTLSGRLLPSCP